MSLASQHQSNKINVPSARLKIHTCGCRTCEKEKKYCGFKTHLKIHTGDPPIPSLPLSSLPLPSPCLPLLIPISPCIRLLSLEVGPIPAKGQGSAVSSPSGVWGGAPAEINSAEINFGAF